MSRKPDERAADVILCCEKVLRYTSGPDRERWPEVDLILDAVLRNIEIIGEATKHIPREWHARMPRVEWKKIAGMRDWIAHVYDRVDPDIVRDAIEVKIPDLLRTLRGFLLELKGKTRTSEGRG